ncbi:hypothetical protein N7539_006523 [Penicillium diatomitis]|uniref:Phosphoglycerate mutase family protein n=1 Tax=Penicillium diatomitis TaxID=2819901 RepID=A0A9W9X398_9EURO|nr:uncharacterized protein N7539_006523 [Penicillium diatomitis]KAJ5483077.1 hypothetical protein N7539_006523 [Penicillium diatomitis]
MTEAPPIVFIARHGARLDAADKNWHLTSPTPYDPPLSYGGWLQARALGLRIASLLEAPQYAGKEPESLLGHPAASSNPTTATSSSIKPGPPLRYNFIIHTSPYLRCLQTAIGVSAGLSHHRSAEHTSESSPLSGATQDLVTENGAQDKRPLLRVDAFLGEWLSPDYFEQIIPPPPSEKMVVSAKTELLRRGEGIPNPRNSRSTSGHFPGGWGSDSASKTTEKEHERQVFPGNAAGSSSLGELSQRPRSSTFNTPTDPAIPRGRALGRLNTDIRPSILSAYKPPTPSYAVSPSDPIPVGYVAHARDACTRIDYQWDSMRTPYWGTGGEYGEEWGLMHERVHAGFQKMIDYYRDGESPSDRGRALSNGSSPVEGPTQTVLIIITHGADCNALIGALAGRSVLLDIGTASLTMAVRRDRLGVASSPSSDRVPESLRAPNLPSSLTDRGARLVSQEYSLQLIASNDHLRAGVNPSQLASLTSPTAPQPLPPPSISSYRNRTASRPSASILQGSFVIDSTPKINTNMRNWSQNRRSSPTSAPPRGGPGLWGSIRSPTIEADEDADENYVPNFGNPTLARPENHEKSDTDPDQTNGPGGLKQLPRRTASQRGLWGSAQTLDDRNATSRRRWTVTDQKL